MTNPAAAAVDEFALYRSLLDDGFVMAHETAQEFQLLGRLVARAQVDGLLVQRREVAYDDTVWDEFDLVEITDPSGQRYGLPLWGAKEARTERRTRVAADWGETLERARTRLAADIAESGGRS